MKSIILKTFAIFIIQFGLFQLDIFSQISSDVTNYFQQEVNYTIRVKLDDKNHYLRGYEEIQYINNSNSVLTEIYFHIWPNAFKNEFTAFGKQKIEAGDKKFYFSKDKDRGFLDSLDFKANGVKLLFSEYNGNHDIVIVTLSKPLYPGESLNISTPFRVKIPETFSRLGHINQQYQITQWYPKPAVFDHKGWHPMPYLDQGEFYSEFGKFDVFITLPKNYVVGASGDLIDGEAEEKWMQNRNQLSLEKLKEPTKETNIVFKEEFSKNELKTLHYRISNTHDFAWFCDKQYYVMTDQIELPNSKRKVKTVALFNEKDKSNWEKATGYLNDAVYFYSKFVGEYPFSICTAVDGALSAGAGMEYPTITVVSGGSESGLKQVIVHEVGHNWFYGILGSNERIHPWLDEGCNSYMEMRTLKAMADRDLSKENKSNQSKSGTIRINGIPLSARAADAVGEKETFFNRYLFKAIEGLNLDQPIEEISENYSPENYGLIVYMKTTFSLRNLENYLGTDLFDKCMKGYFEKWKYKHPYPEDMRKSFEEIAHQDLGWFFVDYFKSADPIDFKALKAGYDPSGKKLNLNVDNKSGFSLPAFIAFKDKNEKIQFTKWSQPILGKSEIKFTGINLDGIKFIDLNSEQPFPEMNHTNNSFVVKKDGTIKRKCTGLNLKFAYSFDRHRRRSINYFPAIGGNTRDGFLLGLGFYMQPSPAKHIEFHALPMYGFGNDKLSGSLGFTYRIFANDIVRKVEFRTRTALFADFLHSKNSIDFYFKPKSFRSNITNILSISSYHIGLRDVTGNKFVFKNDYKPYYVAARWSYLNNKTINKYGIDAEFGFHDQDAIRVMISPKYIRNYTRKGEIHLSAFAGGFITNKNVPKPLRLGLSGSFDPFGENIYFDRPILYADDRPQVTTWLNRQITEDQGSFKSITGVTTANWLVSASGAISMPFTSNIKIFGDIGFLPNENTKLIEKTYFDAGVSVHAFKKILNIYYPLTGSIYNHNVPQSFKNFYQNITFSIKINELLKTTKFFR